MSILDMFDFDNSATYNSNMEYRDFLRDIFFMNLPKNPENPDDIDNETLDENNYDEDVISRTMDVLFELTKGNGLFQQLYVSAAAKMLSEQLEIGQAVLFSYDYLPLFHKCLGCFIKEPSTFDETNEFYVGLMKKLN